ncbi:DUF4178 domain-containing protein [Kovacikia minuta CCNUW1]|uniref:DUF4178 domain-containing protein n=1 Tax=Kovacikia minuta TaxID=2931930 RepID=UPI001CC90379|nr:DUF4178 domain-containing protein [Kovacikia minuta]UBF25200.1 DUF4178 domain-containing protein [Kovacikia minuta CCNUW1]
MAEPVSESQLRPLREGDRLKYHGVQWRIDDYSTYTDENGYETEEWLLHSQTGKEYYLMREVDPQTAPSQIHWYVAEELQYPAIYEPNATRDLVPTLVEDMRSHKTPYPELRVFNRTYQFESQTEGDYESDGATRHRITWDYWDATHLWNLALEAWNNGTLSIYSTREVQPADFTDVQTGRDFATSASSNVPAGSFMITQNQNRSFEVNNSRQKQLIIAWAIVIVGFVLMLSGI